MANPIPVLTEAIMGLGTWRPENGPELLDFLDKLPELMERFQAELAGVFNACTAAGQFEKETTEAADELSDIIADAYDKSIDLHHVFKEESEFWIQGSE